KVESEAARKARLETPRIDPVTLARPLDRPRREEKPAPLLIPQPPSPPAREVPLAREPIVRDPAARDAAAPPRDNPPGLRDAASSLREALSPARDTAPPPAPKREPADRPIQDQPPRHSFLPDPPSELAEPRRAESPSGAAAARAPGRGRARPPPLTDQGLKSF